MIEYITEEKKKILIINGVDRRLSPLSRAGDYNCTANTPGENLGYANRKKKPLENPSIGNTHTFSNIKSILLLPLSTVYPKNWRAARIFSFRGGVQNLYVKNTTRYVEGERRRDKTPLSLYEFQNFPDVVYR